MAIAPEVTPQWRAVLEAGFDISGSEASGKWRAAGARRVNEIGQEPFRSTALRWLALGPYPSNPGAQVAAKEADYQRGLLWSLTDFADAETCAVVAHFAEGERCAVSGRVDDLGAR